MNCAKCNVEIAAESAYAGTWCARCGEKAEERLGKLLDDTAAISPSELARVKASVAASPVASFFITEGLPPDVEPDATTYVDVKEEWEAETGKAVATLRKRRK